MIKICLAILKLPKRHITKRQLHTAWKTNDDGAGFMYNQHGKLIIDKGYFTFKKFYKSLRNAENKNPNAVFVIHLRLATSGKTDKINCHPFAIHEDLGFVHNGIFKNYSHYTNLSDTAVFNLNILQTFPQDFIFNKGIVKLLESYCEYMNKLVFLNNKGEYLIIGEDCGTWEEGIWFSNSGHKTNFGFSGKSYSYDGCECDVCGCFYAFSQVTWNIDTKTYTCEHCKKGNNLVDNLCPICNVILPEEGQYCPICKCFITER